MGPTRVFVLSALLLAIGCGDNVPLQDPGPACSDGVDNDGDGSTDYPFDLGCADAADDTEDSPAAPQCSDGRDNDGDGLRDFPSDPGCFSPLSDSETDDCPDGLNCPQCANGRDDDGNGATDYPNDPGCESADDAIEFLDNPVACGMGLAIKHLPPSGTDSGTLDATSLSSLPTTCGGGGGSSGVAYVMILSQPKIIVASTEDIATMADTVIDLRRADCSNANASLGCNDDFEGNRSSQLTMSLAPGVYYIIVEGHDSTETGPYVLTVQQFSGQGSACTMQSECGPGLVCRVPTGGTGMVCTNPVCSDGVDDDSDGKIDFPADPGCASPEGGSEVDDCPSGPNCPACGNGLDDDGDGQTDFPLDTSCAAASGTIETCNDEQDPIAAITTGTITGTLVGAHDDYAQTCGSGNGLDVLYTLNLPPMATLTIDTEGSAIDTALTLLPATCAEPNLDCDDDGGVSFGASLLQLTGVSAGTYIVAVDGYNATAVGAYDVHVSGTIAAGGSCEGALVASGAITCGAGFSCDGPAGARTCTTQCSDGIDNNGDGKTDFPEDPGCSSPADDAETTVCPGASCPACSDGLDNDGDGQTDFPADTSCHAAGGTSEACVQTEPVVVVTGAATTGTTVGQTNDFQPTCASSVGSGPDVALQLDLPAMQSVNLNLTTSYDSVHVLLDSTCGGAALVCRDPTTMTAQNLAAGRYFVVVDGFSATSAGTFTLTTSGVVAPNGSCEGALFASGALVCPTGLSCAGPVGARTCGSECSDGVDNNGDGKTDFPDDPGCSAPADATEDTVCPGASCPACSDTTDDDGDQLVDFPADFGCASAAGLTEVFCAADVDFGGVIMAAQTFGTLASPAVDNFEQSCQSNTGNDVTFALALPVDVTKLVVDTQGSASLDTVLSVKDASCGAELGCDDDGAPGSDNRSVLTLLGVRAGNYAINVDSFGTSNNGAFKLNVKGTVAAGTVCTSPLFAAGVLDCPVGTTCSAGTCQ